MAYNTYISEIEDEESKSFLEWRAEKCREIPQFQFWDIVIELELLVLSFVRANRTGNFNLYVRSLSSLVCWFFAMDHQNYARWVTVHLRDLRELHEKHPELAQKFEEGLFVAVKSKRSFSSIALDQAHEQLNAVIKGDGGKCYSHFSVQYYL